jgi:hypothetical protein
MPGARGLPTASLICCRCLAAECHLLDRPSIWPDNSRGVLMAIAQEPAEPFAASHRALPACFPDRPEQQDVGFPLMISFTMVVRSVFVHRSTQLALSKEMIFDKHSSFPDLIHRFT